MQIAASHCSLPSLPTSIPAWLEALPHPTGHPYPESQDTGGGSLHGARGVDSMQRAGQGASPHVDPCGTPTHYVSALSFSMIFAMHVGIIFHLYMHVKRDRVSELRGKAA